ncbi:MAG: two-component sensor histidine kinase [Polyangiaceae bacterium]|nr:two-component sensor histidine kinase [Polyangiaceae bacterium]
MEVSGYVALFACVGQLLVALAALWRTSSSALAMPLALFSANLALWNFAGAANELSGKPFWAWDWLDATATPLTAPLGVWFVLTFVGERKRMRLLHRATWIYFGAIALIGLASPILSRSFPVLPGTPRWPFVLFAGIIPTCGFAVARLIAHLRLTTDADESARARLLILALPMAAAIGSTEFLREPLATLGVHVPRLGSVGALFCAVLMAIVSFRMRLFGRELSTSALVFAAGLTILGIVSYLVLFRLLGSHAALLAGGTAVLTAALLTAARQAAATSAERRERVAQLANLGRLSAQLAHDLKNPLAALKGAIQFLQEEHKQGRPIEPHAGFLDLMLNQADRIERVVDAYRRLHRIEPDKRVSDVGALIRDIVALQPFAASPQIKVQVDIEPNLPECALDRDLVPRALENLLRNGFEAMPDGGTVTVRARKAEHADAVHIEVSDTGSGMDARTRERAFDDFFTTKPAGTGLGLPLVKRIAVAHGGDVAILANHPRGTLVRITLPTT